MTPFEVVFVFYIVPMVILWLVIEHEVKEKDMPRASFELSIIGSLIPVLNIVLFLFIVVFAVGDWFEKLHLIDKLYDSLKGRRNDSV